MIGAGPWHKVDVSQDSWQAFTDDNTTQIWIDALCFYVTLITHLLSYLRRITLGCRAMTYCLQGSQTWSHFIFFGAILQWSHDPSGRLGYKGRCKCLIGLTLYTYVTTTHVCLHNTFRLYTFSKLAVLSCMDMLWIWNWIQLLKTMHHASTLCIAFILLQQEMILSKVDRMEESIAQLAERNKVLEELIREMSLKLGTGADMWPL